jgi:hypothetical protein
MTTNGSDLLVAFDLDTPGAEVQILGADFSLRAKWRLPKRPDHLALTEDAVIAVYQRMDDQTFTVCRHSPQGGGEPVCVAGKGLPFSVLAARRRTLLVGYDHILELQFGSEGIKKVASDAMPSLGPILSAFNGNDLVRLDSAGLTALVFSATSGASQFLKFRSPELTSQEANRAASEMLISHVIARPNGEFWLIGGRLNIHVGMPVMMFDRRGSLLGTALVAIPKFEELKRPPTGTPLMGNPTGHLVNNHVLIAGDRLVVADTTAGRCAWFDARNVEASR